MIIFYGHTTKDLVLYRPTKPSFEFENPSLSKFDLEEAISCPILTIGKALHFKNEIEDDIISIFINDPSIFTPSTSRFVSFMIGKSDEKETLDDLFTQEIPTTHSLNGAPVEIESKKILNINPNLSLV